jgi:hypothetical protein
MNPFRCLLNQAGLLFDSNVPCQLVQTFAINALHGNVRASAGLAQVEDAADEFVIQPGLGLCFEHQAIRMLPVAGNDKLQRNLPLQDFIKSLVDSPHAAFTQHRDHAIPVREKPRDRLGQRRRIGNRFGRRARFAEAPILIHIAESTGMSARCQSAAIGCSADLLEVRRMHAAHIGKTAIAA